MKYYKCIIHISMLVFQKGMHTDQYLNFQSNHPLHDKLGLVRTLFHRADNLLSNPDDRLSKQKHLHQSFNQCCYRNSIIDHAISFNKHHNTEAATSIQINKCYLLFRIMVIFVEK